ncbi:hypothetical protein L1987_01046 [Smallanthus sonchifolius]|uniref:Uncharacterized protein n=1 Tax=Smallanthus sonchifolius TaxID=185202 RepID=A0ACB9K475_9ASTR|nr:hypothetical protein L1987_01046 [Smallanthus sonchifolius]
MFRSASLSQLPPDQLLVNFELQFSLTPRSAALYHPLPLRHSHLRRLLLLFVSRPTEYTGDLLVSMVVCT